MEEPGSRNLVIIFKRETNFKITECPPSLPHLTPSVTLSGEWTEKELPQVN